MNKYQKMILGLLLGSTIVSTCALPVVVQAESSLLDSEVTVDENAQWLTLPAADKMALYAQLDQIKQSSASNQSPTTLSNIKELKTEQEYVDLILSTAKQKAIVYLGYDECPYCKAFIPKLNQLAKEKEATIYYYNVRKHRHDQNFKTAMEVYQVNIVPNAFIVKSGKPVQNVTAESTMAELEAFITEAVK